MPGYLFVGALLLLPLAAGADEKGALRDVAACAERNLPQPDTVRAVRIVARDRLGFQKVTVAKIYGRWTEEGHRQQLAQFVKPDELRGAKLLILGDGEQSEIYFKSSELAKVKHIRGVGKAAALFESDFSYEDYEHLQGFKSPVESKRREDAMIGERAAYVVETRPTEAANSAYESIVTFVDKETCVPLRIDFYEPGGRLRKELTVSASDIIKKGSVWVARAALLRDVRDYTTTMLLIDSTEQETLPAAMFSVEALQHTEPVGAPPE